MVKELDPSPGPGFAVQCSFLPRCLAWTCQLWRGLPSQRELTQGRPLPSMLIFSDTEWPAWHCPAAHNWRARVPTHIWPYSPVWRQSWVLSRFSINIWSTGLGDRSQLLPSGLVSDPGMNPATPPRAWEESRDKGQVGGEANRQGPSSGSGGPTARLAP